MRRVLVTGSRELKGIEVVWDALHAQARIAGGLDKVTVIHGCARGADTLAHGFCLYYKVTEEKYPADWKTFGKAAGHIRNGIMVASGADVCLAFPRGASPGTYGCIEKAKAASIPVIIG